jgi:hypothetical protein
LLLRGCQFLALKRGLVSLKIRHLYFENQGLGDGE